MVKLSTGDQFSITAGRAIHGTEINAGDFLLVEMGPPQKGELAVGYPVNHQGGEPWIVGRYYQVGDRAFIGNSPDRLTYEVGKECLVAGPIIGAYRHIDIT